MILPMKTPCPPLGRGSSYKYLARQRHLLQGNYPAPRRENLGLGFWGVWSLSVRLGFLLNTFTMCVTELLSLSPQQKFLHKNHDGTTLSANKFLTYKKEVLGMVYRINKSLLIPETRGLALLDVNWMLSSCFSTCNLNYDANRSKLTGL